MDGGRLIGMARRAAPRAPMETLAAGRIGVAFGLEGDHRGVPRPGKLPRRQVSVLAREAWEAACAELGRELPWWFRRANLLVEGVELPREAGDVIVIGDVRLEVHVEIDPCQRMDEQAPGLFAALVPDWRGGVGCRVLSGGEIAIGDAVTIEKSSPRWERGGGLFVEALPVETRPPLTPPPSNAGAH
jgi:MOSC domain-containing protein YiiM